MPSHFIIIYFSRKQTFFCSQTVKIENILLTFTIIAIKIYKELTTFSKEKANDLILMGPFQDYLYSFTILTELLLAFYRRAAL